MDFVILNNFKEPDLLQGPLQCISCSLWLVAHLPIQLQVYFRALYNVCLVVCGLQHFSPFNLRFTIGPPTCISVVCGLQRISPFNLWFTTGPPTMYVLQSVANNASPPFNFILEKYLGSQFGIFDLGCGGGGRGWKGPNLSLPSELAICDQLYF